MAPKYLGIEKHIFSDTYTLFLKYKDIPDDQYYWEKCTEESRLLSFKYHNHPLATEMIISVLNQLEHRVRRDTRKGKTYEEWEKLILSNR